MKAPFPADTVLFAQWSRKLRACLSEWPCQGEIWSLWSCSMALLADAATRIELATELLRNGDDIALSDEPSSQYKGYIHPLGSLASPKELDWDYTLAMLRDPRLIMKAALSISHARHPDWIALAKAIADGNPHRATNASEDFRALALELRKQPVS